MKKTLLGLSIFAIFALTTQAKEEARFITPLESQPAPMGLDGANIALWQSHGWYFEPKLNRWEWQRARIFQTVEDLYTQSYVIPFLMPMLQNAGAYVMSPRERDFSELEYIIDNDGSLAYEGAWEKLPVKSYTESAGSKKWKNSNEKGFAYSGEMLKEGSHPFLNGSARIVQAVDASEMPSLASWNAPIFQDGEYAVYVSYKSLPNSASDAIYTVNTSAGPRKFKVNQKMGGGTWIYLGHFPFKAGLSEVPLVTLSNVSSDPNAVITADAVKIGGGMGNVGRIVKEGNPEIDYEYAISNYPRFTEGARYWLQWAGAPDSVFTPTDNVNDYNDDYRSRALWVNWMAGGSSSLPEQEGLNVPIDLSMAFHTDAGTTFNDSIIGTLGIYCTESKKDTYPNGQPRLAARDLTDAIMTNIVEDVRSSFEPNWTRRQMWDKSYYEARVPQVPAVLLELLSHQNFADMKYGLDPSFRFTVSRAIYKGMLEFLANRDGRPYVVQPLPVQCAAINWIDGNEYKLSWKETVDTLEESATPTYYIVEERIGLSNGFKQAAIVNAPEYTFTVDDNEIHSYRVIAGNDGGVSFPSEVLALRADGKKPDVLIVNGFTRVSAPDWFDSGEIAGFYDERDPGVPYIYDISFIGSQIEYRRDIPWMDDDASGFGSSRSNYETQVVAGNTFDFTALHGEAIANAGRSFISASAAAFANGDISNAPSTLDLILGKQKEVQSGTGHFGTKYKTFPSELQNRLKEYTSNGGSVFVSGSFIATDLWDNPHSTPEIAEADKKFASEVLGYNWRVGQAATVGEAYEVASPFKSFNGGMFEYSDNLNSAVYAVGSPDSFYAANDKGATIMRYSENNLVAGIAYNPGNYRTVAIGFPFETITEQDQRNALMAQILNFLIPTNK